MADQTLNVSITAPAERWDELEGVLDGLYGEETDYPEGRQAKAKYAIILHFREIVFRDRHRKLSASSPEDIT